jgi:hypothetical protein
MPQQTADISLQSDPKSTDASTIQPTIGLNTLAVPAKAQREFAKAQEIMRREPRPAAAVQTFLQKVQQAKELLARICSEMKDYDAALAVYAELGNASPRPQISRRKSLTPCSPPAAIPKQSKALRRCSNTTPRIVRPSAARSTQAMGAVPTPRPSRVWSGLPSWTQGVANRYCFLRALTTG